MKSRTRLFFAVAVGVLVLGLGTGLVASYVGQNFTIIGGNGPDALSYVPAEARMVAFADIRDLASSELRQKLRQFEPSPDARNKFEEETGVDVERDVDEILAAACPPALVPSPPLSSSPAAVSIPAALKPSSVSTAERSKTTRASASW